MSPQVLLGEGVHTFELVVTDDQGATATDQVTVTINVELAPTNQPPLARASAETTSGNDPLAVQFDGSASNDPDGTIAAYLWTFGDGSTSTETNPSHVYTAHGEYSAYLTVTDNDGESATSSIIPIHVTHEGDGHDHGHSHGDDSLPHPDDPDKQREHLALFDLVHRDESTHIATVSGKWDDPATWVGGVIPTDDAQVLIPEGIAVTLAHENANRLFSVRVDGTLRFDPHHDTLLQVDSLIVDVTGMIEVGTPETPVQPHVTARILILDGGPINTDWDPLLLSRGIMVHGTSSFVGLAKTSFVIAAEDPTAGTNVLKLNQVPENWKTGDRLLIPGVHKPTRTYIRYPDRFTDQHTNNTRLRHVRFLHMGRNDKNIPTTDPTLDSNGNLIASTGINPRDRYAVHFHRTGIQHSSTIVRGCVVEHNPGWGFVNHDSNIRFEDNVSYDTVGAGFVTEIGNELGGFFRNLAVRSKITIRSVGFGGSDRNEKNGFGSEGHGFWMQSPGVELIDNIASGHGQEGFFFHGAFNDQDRDLFEFELQNVPSGVVTNGRKGIRGNRIKAEKVPLRTVRGNHAFGCGTGYAVRWRRRPDTPVSGVGGDVIENFQIWNVGYKGIAIGYASGMIFRNGIILGNVDNPIALSSREIENPIEMANEEEGLTGRGISSNGNVHDVRYENLHVEGFTIGVQATSGGDTKFTNLTLRNVINMRVLTPQDTGIADEKVYYGRTVYASGIVNLPLSSTALNGATQYDVYLMKQLKRGGIAGGGTVDQEFKNHTAPDIVYYNGKQLYYYEQAANAIPFDSSDPPYLTQNREKTSADYLEKYGEYFDKTNAELMSQFGRTLAGGVAPSIAVDGQSQQIFGLVRENVPMPSSKIPQWMPISQPKTGHSYTVGETGSVITWESTGFGKDAIWEIRLHSEDGTSYPIGDGRFPQYGAIQLLQEDSSQELGTHTWIFTWENVGRLARATGTVPPGTYSLLIGSRLDANGRVGFVPFITLR